MHSKLEKICKECYLNPLFHRLQLRERSLLIGTEGGGGGGIKGGAKFECKHFEGGGAKFECMQFEAGAKFECNTFLYRFPFPKISPLTRQFISIILKSNLLHSILVSFDYHISGCQVTHINVRYLYPI